MIGKTTSFNTAYSVQASRPSPKLPLATSNMLETLNVIVDKFPEESSLHIGKSFGAKKIVSCTQVSGVFV